LHVVDVTPNRYDKWTQLGHIPKTKENIKTGVDLDALEFQKNLGTYQNKLADYMGKLPPDLSIIARARSEHFLETFYRKPHNHNFQELQCLELVSIKRDLRMLWSI